MSCELGELSNLNNTHALKFVIMGKTFTPAGIRTYPKQTYGVSEQSPTHFKQKHTLIADNGYIYQHQNATGFEYFSQKKYFSVCGDGNQQGIIPELRQKSQENKKCFNRKKGRLSEFMDKNRWMAGATIIMGHQRDRKGRANSNRDRADRISNYEKRPTYENPVAKKPNVNQKYFQTIADMMSQKLRIRTKRNSLYQGQMPATARSIPHPHIDVIDADDVKERMAKTTLEWQVGKTKQESPKKGEIKSFSLRKKEKAKDQYMSLTKFNEPRELSREFIRTPIVSDPKQTLESWHRTTCSSKWVYNPKKNDTSENQEENVEDTLKI